MSPSRRRSAASRLTSLAPDPGHRVVGRTGAVALTAVLAVIAAAPAAGAAAWSAAQDLSAVSTEAVYPAVAGAGDGVFASVWPRAGTPDRPTEWAFRPPSGSWSSPSRISPGASPTALPSVALNASGQGAVAWTADHTQYVVVRGVDGTWSVPRAFGNSRFAPSRIGLVVDGAGVVTVVWTDYEEDHSRVQAMSRGLDGAWSAPTTLSGPRGSGLAAVEVAADRTVTVLFSGVVTGPGDQRHQVVTRSAAGTWSAPVSLSPPAQGVGVSALDVAPSGAAVVAWSRSSYSAAPAGQVEATVRSPAGAWSPPEVIATAAGRAQLPDVAVTPQGTATVAWQALETEDPGGGQYWATGTGRILTASKDPGGPWAPAAAISPAARVGASDLVGLAADATGATNAVWSSDGAVSAATRGTDGAWGAPQRISVAGQDAALPRIDADGEGAVSAVWQRRAGDGWVVQAAIRSDETIVPGPGPGPGTSVGGGTPTPDGTASPGGPPVTGIPALPSPARPPRAPRATPKGTIGALPRSVRPRARLTLRTSRIATGTKLTATWTRVGRRRVALRTTGRVAGNRVRLATPKARGTYRLTVKRGSRTIRAGRIRVA